MNNKSSSVTNQDLNYALISTQPDRLLQKDIKRQTSIPATLSGGARQGFSGTQTYTLSGSGAETTSLAITPENIISTTFDSRIGTDFTLSLDVDLGLETVPLCLVWYLGAKVTEKGVPDSFTDATLLSGTNATIAGSTVAKATWDKSTLTILITHTAVGGASTDNHIARFKAVVYYDDTGLQNVGL